MKRSEGKRFGSYCLRGRHQTHQQDNGTNSEFVEEHKGCTCVLSEEMMKKISYNESVQLIQYLAYSGPT